MDVYINLENDLMNPDVKFNIDFPKVNESEKTIFENALSNNEEMKQASEIVVKSVSRETQVAGYKELKSDFQSIGNKYQTYVLLEYPIGKANRILYNKIKEDSTLSNQEAADEALAELEAEIDKKISND